ncbi:hypothetical protein ACX1FC_05570 [Legionella pneumophila]
MEKELKDWMRDRINNRNSIPLNTNNLKAITVFGQRDANNQLFDFSITLKLNKAMIQGEWDVIEDAISYKSKNNWDDSKLENLVRDIIHHLQKGGRLRLNPNSSNPYYHIN